MNTTDPDYYGTTQSVRDADTETLLEVHRRASKTFAQCGGHKLAARMDDVMRRVAAELADRDVAL